MTWLPGSSEAAIAVTTTAPATTAAHLHGLHRAAAAVAAAAATMAMALTVVMVHLELLLPPLLLLGNRLLPRRPLADKHRMDTELILLTLAWVLLALLRV